MQRETDTSNSAQVVSNRNNRARERDNLGKKPNENRLETASPWINKSESLLLWSPRQTLPSVRVSTAVLERRESFF